MNRAADIVTHDRFEYPELEKPTSLPLFQTSLFTFPDVASLRDALTDERSTHLYSRGNNPTVEAVEEKIAALERGECAKLFSSGVAAIASAILSNVRSGDHIVIANDSYTWAQYISTTYLERFGVEATRIDATDIEAVERAIKPNTKVLYLESPGSLYLRVQNLPALAALAKGHAITTIVDNTWATPLYQNPLSFGIDLVVHSASKYLGGHSDIIGGVVIGSKERIDHIFRTEFLPIGHVPDPFQAWLIHRGLRTLHVRLAYHYDSALTLCDFLGSHSAVERLYYPMYPLSEDYSLARSQMRGGSGLLSLRLKSRDRAKIEEAVNTFEHFRIGVSWGGYESLVFAPVATANGDPSMLRLHVGLEDPLTLLQDLDRVLALL